MMRRISRIVLLAALAGTLIVGCDSVGKMLGFAADVRWVAWITPASVVEVSYQPETAYPAIHGWSVVSGANFHDNSIQRIEENFSLYSAMDNTHGHAFFQMAQWGDIALEVGRDHYLLVTITTQSGQSIVELWKLAAGGSTGQMARNSVSPTQVSTRLASNTAGMSTAQKLDLALQLAPSLHDVTKESREFELQQRAQ